MAKGSVAQEYINLMAEAFQILASALDYQLYLLGAASRKSDIEIYIKSRFDEAYGRDAQVLLNIIRELLTETMNQPQDDRYIYAAAICQCMDHRIWYADVTADPQMMWDGKNVNLRTLVPIQTAKQPVMLSSLNSNYKETKICITPKFPVSGVSMPNNSDGPSRSLSARNALYGMNGKLKNVRESLIKSPQLHRKMV